MARLAGGEDRDTTGAEGLSSGGSLVVAGENKQAAGEKGGEWL